MKILKLLFVFIALFIISGINNAFSAINFTVSPIKYEIEMDPGESIIRTATLRNNGTGAVTIYTGKSDFEANGSGGMPSFVRYSELVHPDQQISTWITLDTPQFIINTSEEKTVQFQINIPLNATPGGHYGAIFFKNPNSETSSGSGDIGINVDYGILLLVNVSGEVTSTGSVGPIIITPLPSDNGGGNNDDGGSGWGGGYSDTEIDDCPLGDLTPSKYDNKCFENPFIESSENNNENNISGESNNEITDNSTGEENSDDDFEIGFEIPFKNEGNTHIKLIGNIILTDEDGNQIKGIGKEAIKNEYGAVVGEKIVDYIPVNDSEGKVLPGTERKYQCEWEGFPYEDRDEKGKIIMKNWSPSEYYTDISIKKRDFLMFWERVAERKQHKKINADFNLSYINEKGEEIEFNSAKEFYIDYTEQYIGLNPYVIIPIGFFLFLIFIWILLLILNKKRCKECRKKIKKDMKICPYCGTNQEENILLKKKKKKKLTEKEKKILNLRKENDETKSEIESLNKKIAANKKTIKKTTGKKTKSAK